MWTAILEWARTLAGALVGVFIGARLTRGAQDRQFARQQAAQRIDRARTAYQNAVVIAHKLAYVLTPAKGHELIGPQGPARLSGVPKLGAELMGEAVKLRSEGALDAAEALDHAWRTAQRMYDRVASLATVIAMGEPKVNEEFGWHFDRCQDLKFAIRKAEGYWASWLGEQEAVPARVRRVWGLRRRRVPAVTVVQLSDKPPEVME